MKRSEMVRKICELLETQASQGTAYMFKSEQIMQLLEKNGMQPPPIRRLPNMFIDSIGDYGYDAYEWEEETLDIQEKLK